MTLKHLYMIAVASTLACAPAPGSSTPGAPAPRSSTVLAAQEIRDANLDIGTAYDAIARLRPSWLTRGTESYNPPRTEFARVFLNGRLYGELELLRSFDADRIAELRYYSVAEAGKFGLEGGLAGVIEITTKK
jgi:hypothetical protein